MEEQVELTDLEEAFLGADKKRVHSISKDQKQKLALFRELWMEKERFLEAVRLSQGLEESSLQEPIPIRSELIHRGGWLIGGIGFLFLLVMAFCVALFAIASQNDGNTAAQVAAGFAVGVPWLASAPLFLWLNSKYLTYNFFGAERAFLRFLLCGLVWVLPVFFGLGVILYTLISARTTSFVIVVYSTYFGCAFLALILIAVNSMFRSRLQESFFHTVMAMKMAPSGRLGSFHMHERVERNHSQFLGLFSESRAGPNAREELRNEEGRQSNRVETE